MDFKKVLRAFRSPLNPQRWCLTLECGHEVWVTSKSRPKRQTAKCENCPGPDCPARKGKEAGRG